MMWHSEGATAGTTRQEDSMARSIRYAVLAAAFIVGGLLASPALAQTPAPTFSKDIAPIFQSKCQACHQPNSIAPMSLISFAEARPWARSIKQRVSTRQMPPWHIDQSVGVQKFKNDMLSRVFGLETSAFSLASKSNFSPFA